MKKERTERERGGGGGGGGWRGVCKGVFPCFSELTACTDCYRDERDQSLGLLRAH